MKCTPPYISELSVLSMYDLNLRPLSYSFKSITFVHVLSFLSTSTLIWVIIHVLSLPTDLHLVSIPLSFLVTISSFIHFIWPDHLFLLSKSFCTASSFDSMAMKWIYVLYGLTLSYLQRSGLLQLPLLYLACMINNHSFSHIIFWVKMPHVRYTLEQVSMYYVTYVKSISTIKVRR